MTGIKPKELGIGEEATGEEGTTMVEGGEGTGGGGGEGWNPKKELAEVPEERRV